MCKVHDRVFGSVAVEALIKARDNGNVCDKRLAYLEGQVRSFRDWMMDQNEISKEEANKRLLSMVNRIRKELAEDTFDLFVWGGEEMRIDNLTDLNKNSDTLGSKLTAVHEQHGKLEGIAANVAWNAQKRVWMENSQDLCNLGTEWLDDISEQFTGIATGRDAYRIKRFQKRIHVLKFKTKQLMFKHWAYLMNYSNNLLGVERQYPCAEQNISREEADATKPSTKKEEEKEIFNTIDKTEELPIIPEEVAEELIYMAAIENN